MHLPIRYIGKEGEGCGQVLSTAPEDLYRPLGIKVISPDGVDWVETGLSEQWKVRQQGEVKVFDRGDGILFGVGMKMPEVIPCVLFHNI